MKVKAKNVPRRECEMELNGSGIILLDMKTKQYGVTFGAKATIHHDPTGRTLDIVLTADEMEELIVAYEKVKKYKQLHVGLQNAPAFPKRSPPEAWSAAYAEVAGGPPGAEDNDELIFTDDEVRAIARKHGLSDAEAEELVEGSKEGIGP